MRAIMRIAGGLAATAALSIAGATLASADNGDGLLSCNSGEICFAEEPVVFCGGLGWRGWWIGGAGSPVMVGRGPRGSPPVVIRSGGGGW